LNELAAEGNPTGRGGRVLNMNAGSGTTNNLCDGVRKSSDLGLELHASKRLPFEYGNENGQFNDISQWPVFRIIVAPERPQTNPSLTRRWIEDAANRVSKWLRKILLERVVCATDNLDCNDWHAV
jgi:hypothetical protein